MVSVRWRRGLLTPSSSICCLTTAPLVFSCILPTAGRIRDFHPLERAPAGRTVSNPHFKWGFNGNRSAVLYLFRQRRGFAIPFLVPVAPVRGYGSIPPFYHSLPVLLYILVWFPHSHFLPYSRSSLWPISVSLPI